MFFNLGRVNDKLTKVLYKFFDKKTVDSSMLFVGHKKGYVLVLMPIERTIVLYMQYSFETGRFDNISLQVPATQNGFSSLTQTMHNIYMNETNYPIILSRCYSLEDAKQKIGDKSFMNQLMVRSHKISDSGKTPESEAVIKINRLLNVDPQKLSNYRIAKATGIAYSRIWKLRREGLTNINEMKFGTIKQFLKFYDEYFK